MHFKQGVSRNLGKAPHKPIMILAVLKAIDKGVITENKIYITPELVAYFRDYWNALVKTAHTPNFALPFFHLKNEKSGIWNLKCAPGFESAITSSNSIKSLSALREYVYYAYLDEGFFLEMTIPEKRLEAKQFILAKYFNRKSLNEQYDTLNEIEREILKEDPADYQVKMKQLLNQSKEEQEEQRFIRSHSFKKEVSVVYNNTCAVTGLRIDTTANISMIDACHIVPFSESQNDHITNGIALSPNMHRAFDRGLISIDRDYRLLVSKNFIESNSKYAIGQFEGKKLILPHNPNYRPDPNNFKHHRARFAFD